MLHTFARLDVQKHCPDVDRHKFKGADKYEQMNHIAEKIFSEEKPLNFAWAKQLNELVAGAYTKHSLSEMEEVIEELFAYLQVSHDKNR